MDAKNMKTGNKVFIFFLLWFFIGIFILIKFLFKIIKKILTVILIFPLFLKKEKIEPVTYT